VATGLRFLSAGEETGPALDAAGQIDRQTFRGIRMLSPESAQTLEHILGDVPVSQNATDTGWTTGELRAAVNAYREMQEAHRLGRPFIKRRYYQDLASQFGRTEKAFEYRMQNISYVLTLMGRDWLAGLRPARNVGAKIASEIEALINEVEGRNTLPVAGFEARVREEIALPQMSPPVGTQSPKSTSTSVSQFERDASVKAWILREAKGICEACGMHAPFNGADGMPYLEVHHVRHLASDGSDTISNAIAACPNCHRQLHYGVNAQELVARLYQSIKRLVKE
jgi:5-methylcytosine-specific restriction protein A